MKVVKTVCFGEIMLRLSPPGFERFLQSPTLSATFGGGEANVAVSLAHFGFESHYVTALPPNAIGDAALRALRAEGVRVDAIVRTGQRLGIYFAETGASQRASTVIYDRAGSSVSELSPDTLAWDEIMAGAEWFHVTGITPALSAKAAAATAHAIRAARAAGARISVDLNYRRKLWSEAQAQAVMRPLMRDVDVIVANEEDLQAVLGLEVGRPSDVDVTRGRLDVSAYASAAETASRQCGPPLVAITLRGSLSASENTWTAVLWDTTTATLHQAPQYAITLVDRIGGGDSFAAGLIYALASGRPVDAALAFAVAAGALKQTIPGDFNRVSVGEVDALAAGDASGRVKR